MADIRINSLPTTASSTASNDFLAIDGATNGTRKLSAYNPNFGGSVTISGTGTYGALQLPSGTTTIYGIALGTDTNIWRTDAGSVDVGGSSAATINLNVGGSNKGYFYNNGTDTTLAGAGTLTLKSNGTTTGLTLDGGNATVAGALTVNSTTESGDKDTGSIVAQGGLGVEKNANIGGNLTVGGTDIKINNSTGYLYVDSGSSLTGMVLSRNSNILELYTANVARLTISSAGNTTLAGNLTVSGTGNNLFNTSGGNVGIGAASPSGKLTVYGGQTEWGATSSLGFLGYTGGNPIVGAIGALSLLLYTNGAEAGRITSGGNLLLGTTTDGGQKLQVAGEAKITATSAAGGIGGLYIINTAASSFGMSLVMTGSSFSYGSLSGANSTWFNCSGTPISIVTQDAQPINFLTNYTTALTLDSSQRCILAGALRLNNAYTAGAPTATGYVTLQDSAGNTYKVLVGT